MARRYNAATAAALADTETVSVEIDMGAASTFSAFIDGTSVDTAVPYLLETEVAGSWRTVYSGTLNFATAVPFHFQPASNLVGGSGSAVKVAVVPVGAKARLTVTADTNGITNAVVAISTGR